MGFIEEFAKYVCKYAPKYDIRVHSPIIAQGILESDKGRSELARNANNYVGMKYRPGRCPTACGIYYKTGSEQNPDGSYTSSAMKWMKFANMEQCVIGYFDFINTPIYANLKGVTDPRTYLERIKADGYATSLKYVENLMAVIELYDLTKYDNLETTEGESTMKIIALDAGHGMNTSGKRCMKTIDPNQTREWYLNDRIMDRVQELLGDYECKVLRVDDTTGAKDISLAARVKTANDGKADIYVSMHHNAGINGGTGGGTMVFYYSSSGNRLKQAQKLYNAIVNQTSLIGNRSTKVKSYAYYVLKNTNMPAFLVENGFMDSKTDVPIILSADHAEKTAQGVLTFLVNEFDLKKKKGTGNGKNEAQSGNSATESSNKENESTATNYTAGTYTVQKGDTLSKIGSKTGVDWKKIAEYNSIKTPYVIRPGQVLKLTSAFYPAYTGKNTTLVAAMTSLGITSTYAFRKKIAVANNIKNYIGSKEQNTEMYNLLKSGLLKRA